MLEENCYVISDETLECVIIDFGGQSPTECQALSRYISSNNLKPVHLLNTHLHFDHVWGNPYILQEYGLQTEASTRDEFIYGKNLNDQFQLFLGIDYPGEFPCYIARDLDEGDTVTFGNHAFSIISTPGHTPGGICFYCAEENVLFCGDSLFQFGIGRCDLPRSNPQALVQSLREKVLTLPPQTIVYPGHGSSTTIGNEQQNNPYL